MGPANSITLSYLDLGSIWPWATDQATSSRQQRVVRAAVASVTCHNTQLYTRGVTWYR